MPYDNSLDKKVFSKTWENGADRLSVNVYSYNNGPKKLQISRENRNAQGEFRFAKLGRLTREEVEALLPFINQAVSQLD